MLCNDSCATLTLSVQPCHSISRSLVRSGEIEDELDEVEDEDDDELEDEGELDDDDERDDELDDVANAGAGPCSPASSSRRIWPFGLQDGRASAFIKCSSISIA